MSDEIKYPVGCPLMGTKIDEGTCFDIHGVVSGVSPKDEAPEQIYDKPNYITICIQCKYHRVD